MSEATPLDPERIVRTLDRHGVRYVLIGALAARLHGSPRLTADVDITPARDAGNLERLATAMRDLNARVFTEQVPEGLRFDCSARALARGEMWNLVTDAGRMDLAFAPSGTGGYEDLAPGAEPVEAYGVRFLVSGLEDIIRSKEASGRPKDRQDVLVLREILRRRGRE